MRLSLRFVCLATLATAPSFAAQQRTYRSAVVPSTALPFQLPTTAELGRALSGNPFLPAVSPTTVRRVVVDTANARRRVCPMPVLAPDTSRLAKLPTLPPDSARHDPMPVAQPACENPLRR